MPVDLVTVHTLYEPFQLYKRIFFLGGEIRVFDYFVASLANEKMVVLHFCELEPRLAFANLYLCHDTEPLKENKGTIYRGKTDTGMIGVQFLVDLLGGEIGTRSKEGVDDHLSRKGHAKPLRFDLISDFPLSVSVGRTHAAPHQRSYQLSFSK
jgi:hypothetical protein